MARLTNGGVLAHRLPVDPGGQRVLRYGVGIVGLGVIYLGLGAIFPRTPDLLGFSLRFLRYACLGLWVAA